MAQLQSSSLSAWINSLPVTDKETAISLASELEQNPSDFDSFILSLAEIIDFNRLTSLSLLISLTKITIDQPYMQTIINSAFNYIAILFTAPDILDQSYTKGRIVFELCGFFLYDSFSEEWYTKLLIPFENQEESARSIFVDVFLRISETISHETITTCNTHLTKFKNLVQLPEIRKILTVSPQFPTILQNLFSQSVFATDSYQNFYDFFQQEVLTQVNKSNIRQLDDALIVYRSTLFQIMRAFLKAQTADNTIKAIQILIENMKEINKSKFAYTSTNQKKYLEAFALNFESIILKFLLLMKAKFNDINTFYPYLNDSCAPASPETLHTSETNETTDEQFKQIVEQQNNEKKVQLPVTKFFFFAFECLEICSCSLLRLARMIQERIYRIKRALKQNFDQFQRPMLEKELSILQTNCNLIYVYLLVPSRIDTLNELFELVLPYLVQLSGIKSMEIPEDPTLQFSYLPDYIVSSIIRLLLFNIEYHATPPTVSFLTDLVLLFSNKKYIQEQEIKHYIVTIFSDLSSDEQTKYLAISVPHIAELMLPAVLQFYCDVQVTNQQNNENHDRIQYRDTCCQLLMYWFNFREFTQYMVDHVSTKYVKDFIYYLVDGCMYFTNHSIDLMHDIYDNAQDSSDPDAVSENQLNMSNLAVWMRNLNRSVDLMRVIVRFCPQAYDDTLIMDKLTKIVLAFFDLFLKHNDYIQVVISRNPALEPYDLFISIVKFTYASAGTVAFNDGLLGNEMYDIIEMIPDSIKLLSRIRPDGSTSMCADMQKYLVFLQNRKAEIDSQTINYDDAPDEFMDELMWTLMDEPMILPSGHRLDLETLRNFYLNSKTDPFSTRPMTLEECKPDVELKAKIDEYKQKKKEERMTQKK